MALATCSVKKPDRTTVVIPKVTKLIAYFPSNAGWSAMWDKWNAPTVDRDFGKIKSLGFNTVRLIIEASTFGFPQTYPGKIKHLDVAIGLAQSHGLRVQLTLFDQMFDYKRIVDSRQWARQVVGPYHDDPRIHSFELKNEMDPTDPTAMAWARALIPAVRKLGGTVPVTVSPISSSIPALKQMKIALGAAQPDFYSFHYYGEARYAYDSIGAARNAIAPSKLVVGEAGYSTGDASGAVPPDAAAETAQKEFVQAVEKAAIRLRLGAAGLWLYQDLAPGFLGRAPTKEYHYGIVRADGSLKPAAGFITKLWAMIPDAGLLSPNPVVSIGVPAFMRDILADARRMRAQLASG